MSINHPKANSLKVPRTEKEKKKKVESSFDSDKIEYSEPSATNSEEDDSDPETKQGSRRRNQGQRRRFKDDNLVGIKLNIPEFLGKNDPEAYMD